jgi:H+/Cl- antiporter ClcA
MGRPFIIAGILLVIVGLLIVLGDRIGIHLGRLPGDIRIEGRRGGFYFPVVTCLLVSIILSAVAWFFSRR